MVTCPGQRTMEAACGNGYAPAWGSLVVMMMYMATPNTKGTVQGTVLTISKEEDLA